MVVGSTGVGGGSVTLSNARLGDAAATAPPPARNRRSDALALSGNRVAIGLTVGLPPTAYPSLLGLKSHQVVERAAPEA